MIYQSPKIGQEIRQYNGALIRKKITTRNRQVYKPQTAYQAAIIQQCELLQVNLPKTNLNLKKMKSTIASVAIVVALLAGCALGGPVGAVPVGPISVQDNNIGDIVNVGVNIQADIKTEIDSTIVNVLVALLTQIGDLNLGGGAPAAEEQEVAVPLQNGDLLKALGNLKALGEMGEQPKEQLEKVLSEKAEQFVQQLLKKN